MMMMMRRSLKLLHASVLCSSNASLNAKRLERIQRHLQLSVPNSLFLPGTSTATITLLHFTIFIDRLYMREGFNLTQYLWSVFWGMIRRRPCATRIAGFWIPSWNVRGFSAFMSAHPVTLSFRQLQFSGDVGIFREQAITVHRTSH